MTASSHIELGKLAFYFFVCFWSKCKRAKYYDPVSGIVTPCFQYTSPGLHCPLLLTQPSIRYFLSMDSSPGPVLSTEDER